MENDRKNYENIFEKYVTKEYLKSISKIKKYRGDYYKQYITEYRPLTYSLG